MVLSENIAKGILSLYLKAGERVWDEGPVFLRRYIRCHYILMFRDSGKTEICDRIGRIRIEFSRYVEIMQHNISKKTLAGGRLDRLNLLLYIVFISTFRKPTKYFFVLNDAFLCPRPERSTGGI